MNNYPECKDSFFKTDFMDPGFPEVFGQACGDTIQDDCLWVNSHLNTFGIADYGSNKDCLLTIDAGSAPGAM